MLDDSLKGEIQVGYRNFLAADNLKPRLGQRQMIAAIANTLANVGGRDDAGQPPICVVEAGTGTGKTIAYLLATLPLAAATGKRVVIATGTIALQEQLLNKDIPALLASTGWHYSFAMAKGRGRYLCPLRLDQCINAADVRETGQFLFEDEISFNTDTRTVEIYKDMAAALAGQEWDGDRDHWNSALADSDWQPLTIDRRQCVGRNCRYIRECCFFNAREELEEADCLVVNHDLLLADLALGGGAILSAPENTIYIIDEAHRLADKAINHSTADTRIEGTLNWLDKAARQLQTLTQQLGQDTGLIPYLERLEDPLAQAKIKIPRVQPQLLALLENNDQRQQEQYRFSGGDVGDALRQAGVEIADVFSLLLTRLDALADQLQSALGTTHPVVPAVDLENAQQLVGIWQNRCENTLQLWQYYSQAQASAPSMPPTARWVTYSATAGGNLDIQLFAAPTQGGDILRQRLFEPCAGAVLTSATLRMLGTFDEFLKRAGLSENLVCHAVAGAFDYPEAGQLQVPDIGADGGDPQAHTQAIIDNLPELLEEKSGTLVLFSSKRQMEDVYAGVADRVAVKSLMQHDLPLKRLLEKHKSAVDKGEGSAIFGLASLAEGVDLPGDYCTHVIIAKLPFAVPDDPVTATLSEWLENEGGNAFMQLSLPEASLKLNQACGRLLRTEQDRGKVTILDRRVLTRRYGALLLNALPAYKRNF